MEAKKRASIAHVQRDQWVEPVTMKLEDSCITQAEAVFLILISTDDVVSIQH